MGTTTFTPDGFNRRVTVTDVNDAVTTTIYDSLDRVTSVTREGATDLDDEVTTFTYNLLGDLSCTKMPRGNGIERTYDAAGRLTAITRGTAVATPTPSSCLQTGGGMRRERISYAYDAAAAWRTPPEVIRAWTVAGRWEVRQK